MNSLGAVELRMMQTLALAVLDNAGAYDWSVQGFGMLRLYIRKIGRLHIWDSALRYPNVSVVHNHSWDLTSMVLFGELRNTRFRVSDRYGVQMKMQRLVTGYDTKMVTEENNVRLISENLEIYRPGQTYHQQAHEIHRTDALDSTVTLMLRNEDEQGQADVYWPASGTWGTARPRRALEDEIRQTVKRALSKIKNV